MWSHVRDAILQLQGEACWCLLWLRVLKNATPSATVAGDKMLGGTNSNRAYRRGSQCQLGQESTSNHAEQAERSLSLQRLFDVWSPVSMRQRADIPAVLAVAVEHCAEPTLGLGPQHSSAFGVSSLFTSNPTARPLNAWATQETGE
jgi:hypothetical protein